MNEILKKNLRSFILTETQIKNNEPGIEFYRDYVETYSSLEDYIKDSRGTLRSFPEYFITKLQSYISNIYFSSVKIIAIHYKNSEKAFEDINYDKDREFYMNLTFNELLDKITTNERIKKFIAIKLMSETLLNIWSLDDFDEAESFFSASYNEIMDTKIWEFDYLLFSTIYELIR